MWLSDDSKAKKTAVLQVQELAHLKCQRGNEDSEDEDDGDGDEDEKDEVTRDESVSQISDSKGNEELVHKKKFNW